MEEKSINFAAIPQTAVKVLTSPAEFFKTIPKTGGFIEPLVFALIMGFIAGIIHAIVGILGIGYIGRTFLESLGLIIFVPIIVVIVSFISAAILFVIWKLMGSKENYETSYRCVAYLQVLGPVAGILNLIPYAGIILSMLLGLFFIVMASIYAHNIADKKAWIVFGIIFALLLIFQIKAEYNLRNMPPTTKEVREKMEELNRQYQEHLEEAQRQAEEARK
ncbi:MAG TPA: hypothetical protein ENN23_09235 [Deltaproteobacteria bacterium]|nr:hypothetical protein [Deltaproteobacteria bacterium]